MIVNKMLVSTVLIISVISGAFFSSSQSNGKELKARVEGRTLVVTLQNNTDSEIWFWERGNYWGDSSFHLVLQNRETKKFLILQYDNLIYGRHQPDTQQILKGNNAEFRFDLDCHGWGKDRDALRDGNYDIKSVILSSEISNISLSSGVFLDRVRFDFPNKE
jgi:hypothetical protein